MPGRYSVYDESSKAGVPADIKLSARKGTDKENGVNEEEDFMKQKKTMKLWQMLTIIILSVVMLVTMFLPAFRINGAAVSKMTKATMGDLGELVSTEQFDQQIKEYEEEHNVNISKISPLNIMTHSFAKLVGGDQITQEQIQEAKEDETFVKIEKKYNTLRIILWGIYLLALIVIAITILSFCLKWTKYASLIVSAVYGLFAAILFGYLRFGLMGSVAKALSNAVAGSMDAGAGIAAGLAGEMVKSIGAKTLSAFYSISFLLAFIIGLLILVMSVMFIFIGKAEVIDGVVPGFTPDDYEEDDYSEDNEREGFDGISGRGEDHKSVVFPPNVNPVKLQKKQEPMGQVRCIKGNAVTQGFSLPQDRKVIVGKSPQNANLIINNQNVSNIHCSIRYNAFNNTYIVKDHSANGTFVNGNRLMKDTAIEYPAGTVLSLADGSTEIMLG